MITPAAASRAIVFFGLAALSITTSLWLLDRDALQDGAGRWVAITVGSVPPLLLIGVALRRMRRWGGWIALFMVPYLCIATMEIIAGPSAPGRAMLLAGVAIVTFFAAVDAERRSDY